MFAKITGISEVTTLLSALPDVLFSDAKREIGVAVSNTHRIVSDRIIQGKGPLNSRTGALKRSLQIRVTGETLSTLSGSVFTDCIYAPVHEEGAVIVAKDKYKRVPGGPYLNIPLEDNLTKAGVMRYSAKDVFKTQKGFIYKDATSGKHFVAGNKGVMFVLVKKVVIPARLRMVATGDFEMAELMVRLRNLALEG